MNKNCIKLPINIALGIGAYTTKIFIGSEQVEVNVLIDTGSSTLAIDLNKYQPEQDHKLQTTKWAQDVVYGSGGWAGPVIKTQIELNHDQNIKLTQAPIAITSDSQQQNFQNADGIWGLAYHHLNKAYDVSEYLNKQSPKLTSSYPWPFSIDDTTAGIHTFKKELRQYPEHDITPLFSDFEEHKIVPNQFTLKTERSIRYIPKNGMSQSDIEQEPLNQGEMIIGTININTQRPFQSTKVLHDAYYNTHLISVCIDGFDPCSAPPLDTKHLDSFFSNSIIDSGCSFIVLQRKLYEYVINCLQSINPDFIKNIDSFNQMFKQGESYQNSKLNINDWPDIKFYFTGTSEHSCELIIPSDKYWQEHANGPNNWFFMISNQLPHWPDQSICGLPLINSYDCIFDRSDGDQGIIHWINKTKL